MILLVFNIELMWILLHGLFTDKLQFWDIWILISLQIWIFHNIVKIVRQTDKE